jgi:hypothetical protein
MEQRFNKPLVFLSHSKKDRVFIKRLDDDLRKSQIDTWLDEYEIRHGKSWQDSVFELGLPTCDAIIVYLTESSISSPIVKKEMDVGLLQKLSDNNIAFLPYVSEARIRSLLRPDIQALQTPEWNDGNYHSLLPRVVSEIWRSYLERTVASATRDERLKRVEAELELEKDRNQRENFFSLSENAEFEFMWKSFDRAITVEITWGNLNPDKEATPVNSYELSIHLSSVIASLGNYSAFEFDMNHIKYFIREQAQKMLEEMLGISPDDEENKKAIGMKGFPDLTKQLLMYGLTESFTHTENWSGTNRLEYKMMLTKKYFRFRYWLSYNQKSTDSIDMKIIQSAKK